MIRDAMVSKGWAVTFAGMGVNLALGVLYTWSVIKKAIPSDWGWDDADKALPYSIACIVFAVMMVPAGRLQDKIGPRWVATVGGVLTGLGCILASFATTVLWYVIGFGILAGAGIGLGYASATPPAVKWFPARMTGLIAGLVVAGFGLASVYISPLANYMTGNDLTGKPRPALQELITAQAVAGTELKSAQETLTKAEALPQKTGLQEALAMVVAKKSSKQVADAKLLAMKADNIHRTLLFFGVGFLLLVTLLSQFLQVPPPGYRSGRSVASGPSPSATTPPPNVPPGELLKTPLFYLLWIMFACGSGAGLMIIGNLTTIAKIGRIEAGFILVAFLAIGNASGRIIAGMLSDLIGRLWTICIVFLFQAVLMLLLRTGLTDMVAFTVISTLLGFNYGACLSVFPSAVKDNFGLLNFGVNYGLVFTAWGAGGFVFPLLAGKLFEAERAATGAGSYNSAYLIASAALVLAAILTFVTRGVERKFRASVRH
jgi:OFA family oxalate/formate antiporter-like MFS transporter